MKKLLVPTDFSEPAHWALSYAVNIALKTNAEIKLLNVSEKDNFTEGILGDLENVSISEKFKDALQKLAAETENTAWQNIPIQCIVSKGDIVNEVAKVCKNEEIDLLITAAQGKSGWEAKIFGSIAERIIKKVDCPVLTLPKQSIFKPIKKVTFATDFSPLGQKAIEQIHNFAQMFEAHFNFVHIILEEKRSYTNDLRKFRLLADEAIGHDFYDIIEIQANGVIDGLNRYAAEHPIDILAMFRHKRSKLNKLFTISYAETMTTHAGIPILMFSER